MGATISSLSCLSPSALRVGNGVSLERNRLKRLPRSFNATNCPLRLGGSLFIGDNPLAKDVFRHIPASFARQCLQGNISVDPDVLETLTHYKHLPVVPEEEE